MAPHPALPDELRTLEQRWEHITSVPESPRSLMSVIEYSLGSQRKAEVYVNRLLKYLLDPQEPHGMDVEFLRGFLDGLPAELDFREDIHDLSDVVVGEQVWVTERESGDEVSSGIVDLVVEVPNEWFLLIELKFGAEDTQTEFYHNDVTHVGGTPKADCESGQYYLYLRPEDRPEANEPAFTNWTWRSFAEDVLRPFLAENAPRYPQRTVAQLHDLDDDIAEITGMTDQQRNEQERIALYLDHYDAIRDVSETFDDAWERFTSEWAPRLGSVLEDEGLGTASGFEEHVTRFELRREEGATEPWDLRSSSSDWGMVFKDGWWRHTDDLEGSIQSRPDDRNDVRIGFHHRLNADRRNAIADRTLKIYFRNMGANDQSFIDAFSDAFDAREAEIRDALPDEAGVTGNKRDKLVAEYDIDADEHGDFFEAYVAALRTAYLDLVVENEALISIFDDLFGQSLREVYGFEAGR